MFQSFGFGRCRSFLTHGCCEAISACESLWLLECGAVGTMGNDQPALRALFACESGLSEPEIGLEHASNGKRIT